MPESIDAQKKITLELKKDNGCIHISIEDSGDGMSREVLKKVFEKGFTTRGTKDGNGIGMYLVKKIIEKHQGSVEIKSTEGQGTTVHIILPEIQR